ncbi:MAG: phage shock protein operon transcriptional activator [Acidocella sp.]|nr:phage shock protein operon transcriptional activator [Acidocella sp.]
MSETVNLVGESPEFQAMLAHVSALAPLNRPVLLIGERGTGKELIAFRLNFLSARWNRPFLTLNCGALSEGVLDSELFGHEAGAFTGAVRRRAGRFELADGGTMFLDEIGNANQAVQEKLLRVIEYGAFERVGGNDRLQVDVRVIAGTNADLPALAAAGSFRADLLDRLAFDVITLPPLRQRRGDVMVLARHFAARMTAELKREVFAGFAPQAEAALNAHDWPGNVRELRNVVERSVYRCADPSKPLREVIINPFAPDKADVPAPAAATKAAPVPARASGNLRADVDAYERALLTQALHAARFNQKQAALSLGLGYHQLRNALRRHGI